MSLNEMSAKALVCRESAFKIYPMTGRQILQVRASNCFLQEIKGEFVAAACAQPIAAAAVAMRSQLRPCMQRPPGRVVVAQ